MGFQYKMLISGKERILLYLLDYPIQKKDLKRNTDIFNSLTAMEIAEGVFIERHHITNYIRELKAQKYIEEISTQVKSKTRKQLIYFLTNIGKKRAKEIEEELMNKEITILCSDHEVIKLKFPKVAKYLIENKMCQEITDLEVCKLTNYKGVLDTKRISKVERDFIDFTADALKPKYFFGRVKELNTLKTWIDDKELPRFIIIHGMAGIGKTTLASKLIEDYKNVKHLFWHTFNTWDTVRSVLSHLAEFLSKFDEDYLKLYIDFNKPLELEKILGLLKKRLKKFNALFIFDDFQKINEELRNFFASLMEKLEIKSDLKIIVLTRYNIPFYDQQKILVRNSVAELEIEGLDFKSSKEILRRKKLPETKYKEIYKITSGHPLLLEIIESDKKTRRYIYEEIFSKFPLGEQRTLEILSIHREPIPYDAFFVDDSVLPEFIEGLVQKLIIKLTADNFYDTHEFIKEFFYKRLSPNTKRQYHKFGGEFYMKQKKPEGYLEAIYHYIHSQEYRIAIDLALKNAQKIKDHGLSDRFLTVLDELPEAEISLPQWVEILMLKAQVCFITGDWDEALKYYYRSIDISAELAQDDIKAKAHCEIGHILEEQNLIDDALKNFQKSLKISDKMNDKRLIAEAKRGIGRYYWRKNNYKTAEKYLNESLKILKNINDFKLVGTIYIDLGNIYFYLKQIEMYTLQLF